MRPRASQGVDATLAAVATFTAALPVSTLLLEPTWVGRTLLLLTTVAISGVGSRALALRGGQILMVQLVCVVLAAGAIFARGHLWHGLPTFETLGFAGSLVSEALATAHRYAAPAPTTPGLTFVVSGALALVALAVDYLAVTRRSPSLAGLPLLMAFLASAANSGSSLPVHFFLAAAAMWLILVARQGSAVLRRWGTTVSVARTPVRGSLDSEGTSRYASRARALGGVALVAAIVMPAALPQLPPRFLLSGLGRNPLAQGNVSAGVGFSQNIDLAVDLDDPGTAPVLQYTTADPAPPPLRVAVGSTYRSRQGVWLPWGLPPPPLATNPTVGALPGLSSDVPRTRFSMTVTHNRLNPPNIAVPQPLVSADLKGVAWGTDDDTRSVMVTQRPDSYTASYLRLAPTATMLQNTRSILGPERVDIDFSQYLTRDMEELSGPVWSLSERLTAGKTSEFDKAMAIQQHLRADGGFTYSLTLAPPVANQANNDGGYDALMNFLATKRGYCVQFATAMVMMARAAGIPARIGLGFLPGTRNQGVWTVVASDAHAWPELWLDGIGWTRFEPTPSRATPPPYATATTPGGAAGGGSPVDDATAPAPRNTATRDLGDPSTDNGAITDTSLSPVSVFRWVTSGWGPVLLGSLIGVFGSLVVPTAARWRRRRDLIAARTSAQRVEVEWQFLTSSLNDLGIAPAPSRTPRQLRSYYDREAFLGPAGSAALGRAVQTLERSRYAGSAPAAGDLAARELAADTREVLRSAAASRRLGDRVRAGLWPRSGLDQLRAMRSNLVWSVRAPLRDASAVMRQRFSRRR